MYAVENEELAKYTTMKIGGKADLFVVPESEDEIITAVRCCLQKKIPYKVLGNGSNLLISDSGVRGHVIYMKKACQDLFLKDGLVYCGASVMLQRLINFCIENNKSAMEYLFSVPATLGGDIVQNAGRGKQYNKQISDYLAKVRVFDGNKTVEMSKKDCDFQYRDSIFKHCRNFFVLGAYFDFPFQEREIGEQLKQERINLVKKNHDAAYPNFGTVFCQGNSRLMRLLKGLRIGKAAFSSKTSNWICNLGGATSIDVVRIMKIAIFLHKITFQKIKTEVEIW